MNRKSLKLILLTAVLCGVCAVCISLDGRNVTFSPWGDESVAVCIKRNAFEEMIRPWYCEQEDTYYYFLPSALCGRVICNDRLGTDLYMDGEPIPKGGRFSWEDGQICRMKYGGSEIRVRFMESSGLPVIFVHGDSENFRLVDYHKTITAYGTMDVFEADGSISYSGGITINGRGNTTYWLFDKKPFNIKLDQAACILGMERDRDWCLLANAWDYSYMNNKLAFDMASKAGFRYAPGAEYADVYFNGDYRGVYLLAETVEVDRDRVHITDLATGNENANPGTVLSEAEPFDEGDQRGIRLEHIPADITGGYLLERDYKLRADYPGRQMTPSFFETENYGTAFNIKSPKYADEREVSYIRSLTSKMEQTILSADGYSETGEYYLDYIDLLSWVRNYMIAEISYDLDKDVTNTFYYKDADSIDPRFYAGPVWDFDNEFGGTEFYPSAEVLTKLATSGKEKKGGWSQYLYDKPEFSEAVRREWNTFFRRYLSEDAPVNIDSWQKQIEKSVAMDLVRWPRGDGYPVRWPGGEDGFTSHYSFENETDQLKKWIRTRCAFLDTYWGEAREGSME